MAGVNREVCNVKEILAKRLDFKRQPEYLISWLEYPGEDTWETMENLKNISPMI